MSEKSQKKLTTVAGAPVPDNQNAVTAGPRGPMLLQDARARAPSRRAIGLRTSSRRRIKTRALILQFGLRTKRVSIVMIEAHARCQVLQ
jgi:hypothetical protein